MEKSEVIHKYQKYAVYTSVKFLYKLIESMFSN